MMAFALFTCTWPTGIDWLLNTANQRREYLGRIGNERSQFGLGCLEQRPKLFFSIILLFFFNSRCGSVSKQKENLLRFLCVVNGGGARAQKTD